MIAHHLVWTAYGWWLPNDPRGSMSTWIASDAIAELGELHHGRKLAQPCSGAIKSFYRQAELMLKHELLLFNKEQIAVIGSAFATTVSRLQLTCYACAIMSDHVHILLRKHRLPAEQMIHELQEASAQMLQVTGHRSSDHRVWGGPGWKVFQDHPDGVRRTIRYIEENPLKTRQPRQTWPFITEYDGWPLHPGHNPDSPYAKRLRG